MKKLESLLALLGEMERFSPAGDKLSRMIAETNRATDELTEDDLEWVAAARSDPEQRQLRNAAPERKEGQ